MIPTFGRRLLDAAPGDALDLEREAGRSEAFAPLDCLLDHVVRQSLGGTRVAELSKTRARGHQLAVPVLTESDLDWASLARSREAIQRNGFWSVPEKASVRVGPLASAWSLRERGRFGPQVSHDERARLALDSPTAILTWAALVPAVDLLYRPVYLRTVEAGEGDRETQIAEWAAVADALSALGLSGLPAFQAIRYGGGWSQLPVEDRHQALLDYCDDLLHALPDDAGSRLRLHLARPLVEKYYDRARQDGTALQKRVVIAALRPHLVAVWGGDWPAFVAYLGESVHAQEHVATALPAIDLAQAPAADLDAVASATGTTTDDVAAVAAAVFGADALDAADGPDCVAVLRRFWDTFDVEHARQTFASPTSLWGLVDSGSLGPAPDNSGVYGHDLYRSRLPAPLVADVESLWGGHAWSRNPQRTVTEWSPHARMAQAFGPALAFWEGVALTAWFVCEGPYSRTDLPGLPEYHAREIAALADAGAPVDPAFLDAISKAERLLGPPQEVWRDEKTLPSESGLFTITTRVGGGTRRDGFERVRDLITAARRAWADQHLDSYLHARRTLALEGAAGRYHVAVNARGGKPPTIKQTAKQAADAVNLWLGGDLAAFYRLIREKSPAPITDGRLVTRAPDLAVADLYKRLVAALNPNDDSDVSWTARRLLDPATTYVRWLEATGEAPGPDRVKDVVYHRDALGGTDDEAWRTFVRAVEASCLAPNPVTPHPESIEPTSAVLGNARSQAPSTTPTPPPLRPAPPSRRAVGDPPRSGAPADPADKPWWKRLFGG